MTSVQPFDYNGLEVRTVTVDGEPWFVAADVCRALELDNVSMAVASLDDDEKGINSVDTPGGRQDVRVISEAGLYSLTLRSRKPEAKQFKRWVTHEVLPAIRKTGSYGTPGLELDLKNDKHIALIVTAANAALLSLQDAEAKIAELEPAAVAWDSLVNAAGDYSVREAAQILSRDGQIVIGQRRLFDLLKSLRWIQDAARCYQRHVDLGRVRLKTDTYYDPYTGDPHLRQQVRVTAKGVGDLRQHLAGGDGLIVLPAS
jgi:prophage antirepressor-like protein